jgi:hypothetical protein
MNQPRQPLPDEFEIGVDGFIRDTETGEIYGRIPVVLRSLYAAAPGMLVALKQIAADANRVEFMRNKRVLIHADIANILIKQAELP